MWLSRFCLILLAVVLYGCSQQQTGQQQALNGQEEVKDGLLTLFDQMLNDRIKKIDGYTKAIGANPNSPELFYKRALAVIEVKGMQRALGVCEEYKSSGKVEKKYTTDKTNVILKSINALNHEVTQTITQHKDCLKSGDSQQVVDAYRQRAVLMTYNQYDVRSDLKRAAELNSRFYQAYEMRADYLYFNDFIDDNILDAIEDYSKAISASPDNAQLYAKRGFLYRCRTIAINTVCTMLIAAKPHSWIRASREGIFAGPIRSMMCLARNMRVAKTSMSRLMNVTKRPIPRNLKT